MLKIVINSNYQSAGTKVCIDDLIPQLEQAGHSVTRNDWQNYQDYDLALFMSPDAAVQQAKTINHKLTTGIMVPMTENKQLKANARAADFLLVGSIEARDEQLKYNQNIHVYYHFPRMGHQHKQHRNSDPIKIGYHGNLSHLVTFSPVIQHALSTLGTKHDIELWAIYNQLQHGRWQRGVPENVSVKHIQWTPDIFETHLSQCDIGIVNNNIPMRPGWHHLITAPARRYLKMQVTPYEASDTITRYKYPTNPGRIYPFARLGIPVVADFTPSMAQTIRHNHSGLLAHSAAGWQNALAVLIQSPTLRQTLSDNLRAHIENNISIEQNFQKLNQFLMKQVGKLEKNRVATATPKF